MRNSRSSHSAGTALNFRNAVGVLTNKLALRLGAVGLVTFPIASRLFANGFTFGLGSLAVSDTMRLLANSYAFRAVKHFTSFIGTFNFTFRLFTFDITNSIFRFSTAGVAFRRFANRVTDGRAVRVIALP